MAAGEDRARSESMKNQSTDTETAHEQTENRNGQNGEERQSKKPRSNRTQGTSGPEYKESNMRLPYNVEIGPIMKVKDVLAAKPGDPPLDYKEVMMQPTMEELYNHLQATLDKRPNEKPMFGPERPPRQS